jgi:type I restriction enzyme S subunit
MSSKTKTTATKEEAKPALVPKLRFPEFWGAGDWTTESLGSVAKISTEKVGDNTCIPMSITSGVGLVSQMEKFGRIIAGSSYTNYLLLKKNDFAYNKSATKEYPEGFIALYSGDDLAAVPNSIFTCFRIKGESPVPQYLNYLLLGNLHGRWLRNFIEVGARAHGSLSIDENDLLALPVPLPNGKTSVREQQKIAECLSSVDELMAAQARKVDALKTHKKGLMQQLFPREGETQPRLRFPEFQNAGEWKREPLGSLCARIMDGTHFSPKSKDGPRPYLTSKNIKDGRIDLSNLSYISEEEHAEIYNKCPVKLHDVLLTKDGANTGNCALNNLDFEFSLLSSVAVLRGNPSKLRQEFLFQSILSDSVQSLISESMSGQAITRITLAKIGGFTIPVTSPDEQQRIASCLGSLDALITAETQKLEAHKTHKKGLMQQLFPSVGGVAGEA